MSKKDKKQINQKPAPATTQSSVSFSLNKLFDKISSIRPPEIIIIAVMLGYVFFMLGGGFYSATSEGIMTSMYYNNKFYFLYPSLSDQFVSDTVISIMLYVIGFAGLLSIYQSTRNANKPRQAYMLLAVGVSLVILSYIFLESAIAIKTAGIT
ncbi:MAG: hypothetical protein FWH37_04490 [Candidatus Bathyarchaeota archaeon]|nr:hypothetical protein [Candidatus Termiticorpusculum sp.]